MDNKKIVYCHFAFRRPREKTYGIFATALYGDFEGKRLIVKKVRAFDLWEDHQHITAIQAYEHALMCLWEWQAELREHGVTNIILVTDNSTLAGWIEDVKKNKAYTGFMMKANEPYKVGGKREVYLPIGLCEPRESEKSHKYCQEKYLNNEIPKKNNTKNSVSTLKMEQTGLKSVLDILGEDAPDGLDKITEVK